MAKTKRRREDTGEGWLPAADVGANKRVKRTDEDAQLAKLYNDLADDVQTIRIKAAGDLLKFIASDPQQRNERLGPAQQRLIRGLCSGRKAARLGFSIALTELFRLTFSGELSDSGDALRMRPLLSDIVRLTTPEGNVNGQERRDHLLGRRFAYQALLQCGVLSRRDVSRADWTLLLDSVLELASQKQWLRNEILGMLHDHLKGHSTDDIETDRLEYLLQSALEKQMLKTIEGIGLWLTIRERFPATQVPKNIWRKDDPLSAKSRDDLRKVLADNVSDDGLPATKSGTRQIIPSFAWDVMLSRLYAVNEDGTTKPEFNDFWTTCVCPLYFSNKSSPERKALGLQIFSIAIATAPPAYLRHTVDERILVCIQDQRTKPDNALFEQAKAALNSLVARAKKEPHVVCTLVEGIMEHGVRNFDQHTKTKTVESMIAAASDKSLMGLVEWARSTILGLVTSTDAQSKGSVQSIADALLLMVRTHKDKVGQLERGSEFRDPEESQNNSWLDSLLEHVACYAYTQEKLMPVFQPKLMSMLSILITGSLRQSLQAPVIVARTVKGNTVSEVASSPRAKEVVDRAHTTIRDMYEKEKKGDYLLSRLIPGREAFVLLFSLSILQVYNDEPDAVGLLEDLLMCYDSLGDGEDSMTILVELLLSFVSKPSALFRKLTEQVFTAVASEVTADSLQSLVDILEQKESLTGQQELFDSRDDDGEGEEVDAQEIDVEDMSDVELVNGDPKVEDDDTGSDDETSSEVEDGATDGENDEEALFDRKLAEALGTGRLESDGSDEDDSDMDDEQMMELEPHLTSIFKERQKNSSKKQEQKDAKENIVNFKNRVLDLLAIFLKSQHASVFALDTILPLVTLVRTTTNRQTGDKAFAVLKQYFEACSKKKEYPQPEDSEVVFELLNNVHEEIKRGVSKLHANACSRSSLFIAKVLVGEDKSHYERIAGMYATMMSEWWQEPKNKIQPSFFTEWTSWSITTRKQG